jgi:hypothetical protein
MQLRRIARILTTGSLAIGLASAGAAPALAASSAKHQKAPLLKALTWMRNLRSYGCQGA